MKTVEVTICVWDGQATPNHVTEMAWKSIPESIRPMVVGIHCNGVDNPFNGFGVSVNWLAMGGDSTDFRRVCSGRLFTDGNYSSDCYNDDFKPLRNALDSVVKSISSK